MLNSLTVSSVLADSLPIHDRILLENVPSGEEHLMTLIKAIKANTKVEVNYARFEHMGFSIKVAPYALKLWHQRWYLLASNGEYLNTYSLDRMRDVHILNQTFKLPEDFSAAAFFNEFYGILTDSSIPLQHVRLRTYGNTTNYVRTLPFHHSQKEIETTDEYSEFTLDIRPTYDFVIALGSHGVGMEVLEPSALRSEVIEWHRMALYRCK